MKKSFCIKLVAGVLAAFSAIAAAPSAERAPKPGQAGINLSGTHSFDFLAGEWRVHHRIQRADHDWMQIDGTSVNRPMMNGAANLEENVFNRPGDVSHAIALRFIRSENSRVVDLVARRPLSIGPARSASEGPFRRRRRYVLRPGYGRRQAGPSALHLVGHHSHLRSLAAGVLVRRRQDVGDELDRGVPASCTMT